MNYIMLPSRGRPGTRPYPLFLTAEGRPWPQEAGGFGAGTTAGRLDRLREGSNKEDTMEKIGGQHTVPKTRRTDDLDMEMADMDIYRVFDVRSAEADRKLYRANTEKQILMEMERAEAKRWKMVWGTTCDIAAACSGGCFVAAVQKQSFLWLAVSVIIFVASRIARRAD